MKTILIIAAHPDDEILGCGATISRLVQEGFEAYTLILGEGITSRDFSRNREENEKEIIKLKNQIIKANNLIGVKEVFSYDFPDNRFDSVDLLDIVKVIEKIKQKLKPDIIFTHHGDDLNIDHKVTFNAVLTATRPLQEESVRELYSFEVLSSTEWNFPLNFSPNIFYDVTSSIERKIKAMQCYEGELRDFPHPRSLRAIQLSAENWGMKMGIAYAEAFQLIRKIN